jgi:hypothetical protein
MLKQSLFGKVGAMCGAKVPPGDAETVTLSKKKVH